MRTHRNLLALLVVVNVFTNSFAQTARSGPSSSTTTNSASSGGNNNLQIDTLKIDSTIYQFEKIKLPRNRILNFPIEKTMLCAKLKNIQAITVSGDSLQISFDRSRFNKLRQNVIYNFPVKILSDLSPSTKVFIIFIWDISNCDSVGNPINGDLVDDFITESTSIVANKPAKKVLTNAKVAKVISTNQQKSTAEKSSTQRVNNEIKTEAKVVQTAKNEEVLDLKPNIQARETLPEQPTVTTVIGVLSHWNLEISEQMSVKQNVKNATVIKDKLIIANPK